MKQRFKVTDMRKAFNAQLVDPRKCSKLRSIYLETKSVDGIVEDAIVDIRTGDIDAAIQKLGMAKAIMANEG